jgi:hypothetical protein
VTFYSMKEFLEDMTTQSVSPDEQIYSYLCTTDTQKLKQLIARLEKLKLIDTKTILVNRKAWNDMLGICRQHTHKTLPAINAVRSKLLGKTLEQIVLLLFKGCTFITSTTNIRTTTAEIDLFASFGPTSKVMPMFGSGITHMIGEAKCYSSGFKSEWVNELVGLMDHHNTTHSVLFVASAEKKLRTEHRHGLQLHSARGKHVIPFGLAQLRSIASGKNFLSMLSTQFINVTAGHPDLHI